MLGDSIRRRRQVRPQPGENEAESRDPLDEAERGGGSRHERGSQAREPFGWLQWLGVAVVVLLASFGAGYLLATQVFFPPPATAGVGVPVPELYGLDQATAERRLQEVGLWVGSVTEVASRRTGPGQVVAQEPIPEQQLRPGASVSLAVSAGAPAVRVPTLAGLRAGPARDLLETAGFEVDVGTVRVSGPRDAVIRTEPAAGTVVRLPAMVTLIINLGPEEPEVVEPVDSPAPAPVDPIWP